MDVKKSLGLIAALCLLNFGCDSDERPEGTATFEKPDSSDPCDDQRIAGQYLVHWKSGEKTIVESQSDEAFEAHFMAENQAEILRAEPHFYIEVKPRVSVARADFQAKGYGGDLNWGARSISAPEVWAKGITGQGVLVAVIDSGVQLSHPELESQFFVKEEEIINGIDDDDNGYIDDRIGYDFASDSHQVLDHTGHGTHVSGIIAASHDEGSVLGVAPGAKILPLSFISSDGRGSTFDAIRAVRYAALSGAKVINASWGGSQCSLELQAEIEILREKNVLFVSAAGNSGQDISRYPEYPAVFPLDNLLTVGASTFDHYTAGFSNFGALVDVVAPGAFILSTFPEEFETVDADEQKDGVQELDGTSMATPFVAGAAALLWSAQPEASYKEIIEALLESVDAGFYDVASRGQINVNKAMEYMQNPQ